MEAKGKSRGHRRAASCYNFHFNELGITTDSAGDSAGQQPLSQKSFCPSASVFEKNATPTTRDGDSLSSGLRKNELEDFDFFDYFSKNNHPTLRDSVGETSVIVEELDQGEVDRLKRGLGLKYGGGGARVLRERKGFENEPETSQNGSKIDRFGRLMEICESPKSDAKKEASSRIMKIQVKYISELGKIEEDVHEMSLANSRNSLTLKNSAQKTLARIVRCSGSGMKMFQEQSGPENLILEEFSIDDGANKENMYPTVNKLTPKAQVPVPFTHKTTLNEKQEKQYHGQNAQTMKPIAQTQHKTLQIEHGTSDILQKEPVEMYPPTKSSHQRSESISMLKTKLQNLYNQHRVQSVSSLAPGGPNPKTHSRHSSLLGSKQTSTSPTPRGTASRNNRPLSGTNHPQAKETSANRHKQTTCPFTTIFTETRSSLSGHNQKATCYSGHRKQPSLTSTPRTPLQNTSVSSIQSTTKDVFGRHPYQMSQPLGFLNHQSSANPSPRPQVTLIKPTAKHNMVASAFNPKPQTCTKNPQPAAPDSSSRRSQILLQKCHSSDNHPTLNYPQTQQPQRPLQDLLNKPSGTYASELPAYPTHSPKTTISSLFLQSQPNLNTAPVLPNTVDSLMHLAQLQRDCLAALLKRLTSLEDESLQLSLGCSNLQLQNTCLQAEIKSLSLATSTTQGLCLASGKQRGSCVQ